MAITSYKAERVTSASGNDDILPMRPNHKYFYMHHVNAWEFSTGKWLPLLKRFTLRPGVNGVNEGPNGYRNAKSNLEADGWFVIPHTIPVISSNEAGDGFVEDIGYLCSLHGKGGKVYTDIWHTPLVTGAGRSARVDWKHNFDRRGFDAWRAMLVERGFISAPVPSVIRGLIERQRSTVQRNELMANPGNPHGMKKYEGHLELLTAMEASVKPGATKRRRKTKESQNV